MKNSKDIIENRARDLPACTAVPQPTAPMSGFRTPLPTSFHGMYMDTFTFNLYLVRYVDSTQSGFRADIHQRILKPTASSTSITTHFRKLCCVQHTTAHYSTLHHTTAHYRILHHTTAHYSTLQNTTPHYSTRLSTFPFFLCFTWQQHCTVLRLLIT
jgi:hypothetical protein